MRLCGILSSDCWKQTSSINVIIFYFFTFSDLISSFFHVMVWLDHFLVSSLIIMFSLCLSHLFLLYFRNIGSIQLDQVGAGRKGKNFQNLNQHQQPTPTLPLIESLHFSSKLLIGPRAKPVAPPSLCDLALPPLSFTLQSRHRMMRTFQQQ